MDPNKLKKVILAAKVLLVVVHLSAGWRVIQFFQVKYQLSTPLVPQQTIIEIASPVLANALIAIVGATIALILLYWKKYWAVIVICVIALIVQPYNLYLFF